MSPSCASEGCMCERYLAGWCLPHPPVSRVTANGPFQRVRWEGAAKGWRVRLSQPMVLAHLHTGFWRLPCACCCEG